MKYLKTYETYKLNPLSDKEINFVFEKITKRLNILGLCLQQDIQMYGDHLKEEKHKIIFKIVNDLSIFKNSIIGILLHSCFKEPYTYAEVLNGHEAFIINLNEFPNENNVEILTKDPYYINPQTKQELYKNIIEKIIYNYQSRSNKVKITTKKLATSSVSNIYTPNETNIDFKKLILDYLNSMLNNENIPEYIFKEVAKNIEYVENIYTTSHEINSDEALKTIYKGILKYLSNDLKKASEMGKAGFGD